MCGSLTTCLWVLISLAALAAAMSGSSSGGLVASWVVYTPPSVEVKETEATEEPSEPEPVEESTEESADAAPTDREKISVLIFYAVNKE